MATGRQWNQAISQSANIEFKKIEVAETRHAQDMRVEKGLDPLGYPEMKLPDGIEPGM